MNNSPSLSMFPILQQNVNIVKPQNPPFKKINKIEHINEHKYNDPISHFSQYFNKAKKKRI